MRIFVAVLLLFMSIPAHANSSYDAFRSNFENASVDARLIVQEALIAGGFLRREYSKNFYREIWHAIQDYRRYIRRPGDYPVTGEEIRAIRETVEPIFGGWDLHTVRLPEAPDTEIVLPVGLDLRADPLINGALVRNEGNSFRLQFLYLPGVDNTNEFFWRVRNEMTGAGDQIVRSETTLEHFILHARQGIFNRMVRYHTHPRGGMVGFELNWSNDSAPVYGDRLALLISSYLRMIMVEDYTPPYTQHTSFPWDQTASTAPRQRGGPPPVAAAPHADHREPPRSARAAPPREDREEGTASVGSGFFVSRAGILVTNAHVVDGCTTVDLISHGSGVMRDARVLVQDDERDLALVATPRAVEHAATLRTNVRLGEEIAVFGFPHTQLLDPSGVFTVGHVTAERGIGGDRDEFQISAGVQSGNSGGPVLDMTGRVVGVVVAKLNWLALMENDDFPQNVNFAVQGDVLIDFLRENRIMVETVNGDREELKTADIAQHARNISAFVACGD